MPLTDEETCGPINLILDLPEITVRQRSVSAMDNNVYLLTSKTSGTQVLIDAADAPNAVIELVQSAHADTPCKTSLATIITTHQHWDHIRALKEVSERTETATAAGADDAEAIEQETGIHPKVVLHHGDTAQFDGVSLEVIGLRGHTPGSVALAYHPAEDAPSIIFTGDSLFPGGVGNTDSDPQRFSSLINDVTERIFENYEDDTVILPGHGASTVLGDERPQLAQWRERGW